MAELIYREKVSQWERRKPGSSGTHELVRRQKVGRCGWSPQMMEKDGGDYWEEGPIKEETEEMRG